MSAQKWGSHCDLPQRCLAVLLRHLRGLLACLAGGGAVNYVFRTYLITAGNLAAAKAKLEAKGQDGRFLYPGLPGHFATELSGTGALPATRHAASGLFSPEEATYLDAQLPRSVDISDGTLTTTVDGQSVTVAEGPHEMFARLGLKIIAPAI